METYQSQKYSYFQLIVLTVPMRNGNVSRGTWRTKNRGWFLPYLWGMETIHAFMRYWIVRKGSYRTYEEWKLRISPAFWVQEYGSYRTYEEWKPTDVNGRGAPPIGSYRTYEEWKPKSNIMDFNNLFKFLPYLWGMETCIEHIETKRIWFLPYLWGMETYIFRP